MGGSRIFDWGGPRIEKARDDRQNVALFALKSWPIGGGHGPVPPPPGTALGCWGRGCYWAVTICQLGFMYVNNRS